ncbi:MAG: YdcF family protein [Cellvibrionaceae bacterium]
MIITLLKTFLLPPALQLLMVIVGLIFWRKKKILASLLFIASFSSLLLLSIPMVSANLFRWLEAPYLTSAVSPDLDSPAIGAQAIVVLGGGRQRHLPEYEEDQVSYQSLWRLRYGAHLAKELQLPVIVSGGTVYPYETLSEAEIAAKLLKEDYGVDEVILESNSRDTWQNAQNTSILVKEKGIESLIVVTHAYHMRRAELAFSKAGLTIIPKPTGFYSVDIDGWIDDWLPKASALYLSQIALHEYIGLLFYQLR